MILTKMYATLQNQSERYASLKGILDSSIFARNQLTLKKASLEVMMSGTFQKCRPKPSFATSVHSNQTETMT